MRGHHQGIHTPASLWLNGHSLCGPSHHSHTCMLSHSGLREISKSKLSSMKRESRTAPTVVPCGFDVVWAGRRHAQIPVILDSESVLHCVITASPPTKVQLFRLRSGRHDITPGHRQMWIRDSARQDWKFRRHRAVIFSGLGGTPARDS